MWEVLGRVDIVFGILGGIITLWELITAFRKRLGNREEAESPLARRSRTQDSKQPSQLIGYAVDSARRPIGCTAVIAIIFVAVLIIAAGEVGADATGAILVIVALAFSAIFVGLVIGVVIDVLAKASGKPIEFATWASVIFSGLSFMSLSASNASSQNLWIGPTVLPSALGAALGAIVGFVSERDEKSRIIHPDGTWEKAEEIALSRLKAKLEDKYHWTFHRLEIGNSKRGQDRSNLIVSVVEEKSEAFGVRRWWPVDRYQITIDKRGDISEMSKLTINQSEQYKDPLEDFAKRMGVGPTSSRVTLIEVKKPIADTSSRSVKIRIEFLVENSGHARKIYPYVQYEIAKMAGGKYVTEVIESPSDWVVELRPFSRTHIAFEAEHDPTAVVLTKGSHAVKVKLYLGPRV